MQSPLPPPSFSTSLSPLLLLRRPCDAMRERESEGWWRDSLLAFEPRPPPPPEGGRERHCAKPRGREVWRRRRSRKATSRPVVPFFSFFGAGTERKQWLVGWLVWPFRTKKKAADSSAVCYPGVFLFSARVTIRTALVGS